MQTFLNKILVEECAVENEALPLKWWRNDEEKPIVHWLQQLLHKSKVQYNS